MIITVDLLDLIAIIPVTVILLIFGVLYLLKDRRRGE